MADRRVLVLKHVAQENLGSLKPVLNAAGCRLRYVNFGRDPEAAPSLDRCGGVVLLGGWMGAYEADLYPHLKREFQLVEQALARGLPVLGICLGSQILAQVLGAPVRKHHQRESGWCEVELTEEGMADAVVAPLGPRASVFQMHGDTFDLPPGAVHLARSSVCPVQAFRYGPSAYGLQFHLEVDARMIHHLFYDERTRSELEALEGPALFDRLAADTPLRLPRSNALSEQVFGRFVDLLGLPPRPVAGQGRR